MRFFVTSDANAEANLHEVLYALDDHGFDAYFHDRFYDDSGKEMCVVLMCRNPRLNFKQRIRFVKKENCLYMDIMLDLDVMSQLDLSSRKQIVGEKMVREIPRIVAKYKFKDFDLPTFPSDLREWFETHGWITSEFPDTIE